jgi:LmbE family N-acetylglucosaminyl deacetylase
MCVVKRAARAVLWLSLLVIGAPAVARADILVVAPHPDDDVILGAGVISRALARGERVYVVYVTNGDRSGPSTGALRQGEAVSSQAALGMPENRLIFLGYPDAYVFEIRDRFRYPWDYSDPDQPLVTPFGISSTYGTRGLGGTDYHSYRFGAPGSYRWETMLDDMADVITTIRPSHIFTTSQWDTHLDHEATYFLVHDALVRVLSAVPGYNPTIHKTTIWPGDTSWPAALDSTAYFTQIPKPPFTNRWGANPLTWPERESLDVPLPMQSTAYGQNPKYVAVDRHQSQDGVSGYIGRWVHKDEFFWTEQLSGTNRPPVPNAGLGQQANEGMLVTLDGSGSFDPDNTSLSYQWRQTSGPAVALSDAGSVQPTFTTPTGLAADVTLEFELVVSDGELSSVPDAVSVVARSHIPPPEYGPNLAPSATITASSQRVASGQTANKVADGSPLGYPTDAAREWATSGQGVGAWISMTWPEPVTIAKLVLYDRPNTGDQLVAGVVTFSDGSTLAVGPLTNEGQRAEYPFPARTVTSLRLDVTAVSASTANVGLAEFEVFELGGINRPPTAHAGADQVVAGGQSVTLDGSTSSDPNNTPLVYGWTQIAGATVTLLDSQSATPSFTAPAALPGPQVLRFQLVVSDGELSSQPDTVDIRIPGTVNLPPVANAGPDVTVSGGSAVTLDGSASADPELQPVTYEWSQTAGAPVSLTNPTAASPSFVLPVTATDGVLTFQLVVHDGQLASAADTVTITVVALPSAASNIAPAASVTASTQRASRQAASKAVDGFIDGYPIDPSHEWATVTERAGAWIELRWPAAYVINRIRLHDRPNLDDQVRSATLSFSDGTTVPVGPLSNDGAGLDVVFAPRRVTWVRLTVDSVAPTTANIGLAEILVFEQSGTTADQPPTAFAGPNQDVPGGAPAQLDGSGSTDPEHTPLTFQWQQIAGPAVTIADPSAPVTTFTAPAAIRTAQLLSFRLTVHDGISSSVDTVDVTVIALPNAVPVANAGADREVTAGAAVQLDGRGSSDADGDALTYAWTQTAGTAVTLTGAATSQPAFTAPPVQTAPQQLIFRLVVSDGLVNSAADTVTITIPGQPDPTNVALTAVVTASSQRSTTQAATKAIDGIASGYPVNSAAEWSSNGQRAGAWIQLDWPSNRTVNRIRLFDRPNTSDWVTSGTLLFSDGTSITVGALPNNGAPLELTFTARTIRWVRFRIDTVSAATGNAGLSEFEVYGTP